MSHERCTKPNGNKGCIDCVAYGAAEERERIIALLKAEEKRLYIEDQLPVASHIFGMAVQLIKDQSKP